MSMIYKYEALTKRNHIYIYMTVTITDQRAFMQFSAGLLFKDMPNLTRYAK